MRTLGTPPRQIGLNVGGSFMPHIVSVYEWCCDGSGVD